MSQTQTTAARDFDAIVVGAGISGLYALYRLREKGLEVRAFEAGTGVGGTWYWNRYPGARTDSQSEIYQYWFSDELLKEWNWSERFPAQTETERYLNFVADKFELRKDIQFETKVLSASWDAANANWRVTTDRGETLTTQFFLMCTGGLSAPVMPNIPGIDDFNGESYHTGKWPRTPVDFKGKRVGVIGTAATGIQVIQTIKGDVASMTVFQRTPNYTIPMRNPKYDEKLTAEVKAKYPTLRHRVHETFAGFDYDFDARPFAEIPEAERNEIMEKMWADGSLAFWVGTFREVFTDPEVNAIISAFVRDKIRARLKDPKVAEKLIPRDYGFGTRRVPLETKYYEAFNQDNVELVDLRATPIERITARGVKTTAAEYELDVLVFATGFDAGTGALTRVDIRGREGQSLKEAWSTGLRTTFGMQVHGFPNLFLTMAPMSPAAAFCNVPTCSQQQTDWIADAILYTRAHGRAIEPTAEFERAWVAHHDEVANMTLVPKTNSWYMGANIEGKERRLLAYAGGVSTYRNACEEVKQKHYEGFAVA
jgi:acetone monooxygenase